MDIKKSLTKPKWWLKAILVTILTSLGLLVFKQVVGWTSQIVSVNFALMIELALVLVIAIMGMTLRKGKENLKDSFLMVIIVSILSLGLTAFFPSLNILFSLEVVSSAGIIAGITLLVGTVWLAEGIIGRIKQLN